MDIKSFDIPCGEYSVSADWYEGRSTDEIIFSLIGWTSTKATYGNIMEAICQGTGSSGLVFDYSGHGDSDIDVGLTTPAQHLLEVFAVFDWIKDRYPQAKFTVMGSSYGCYMTALLMEQRVFDRVILRAPAIYRPEDMKLLAKDRLASEETDIYRNDADGLAKDPLLASIESFKGKSFVVVHEKDEVCHKPSTDAYIKALNADSWVAPGAPHSIREMSEEWFKIYQEKISAWINTN